MFPAPTSPASSQPAILVVENDEGVRRVMQRMLTYVGGRATTAADTASAVALVQAQPDLALALIDLSLDGSNGVTTADALQALRPDLPIILLSSNPERAVATQAFVGTWGVLGKPCSLDDLATLVAAVAAHRVAQAAGSCV